MSTGMGKSICFFGATTYYTDLSFVRFLDDVISKTVTSSANPHSCSGILEADRSNTREAVPTCLRGRVVLLQGGIWEERSAKVNKPILSYSHPLTKPTNLSYPICRAQLRIRKRLSNTGLLITSPNCFKFWSAAVLPGHAKKVGWG